MDKFGTPDSFATKWLPGLNGRRRRVVLALASVIVVPISGCLDAPPTANSSPENPGVPHASEDSDTGDSPTRLRQNFVSSAPAAAIQLVSAWVDVPTEEIADVATMVPQEDEATARQSPPNRVAALPVPPLARRGRTYSAGQLHKNTTTMVLVYEPDIRAQWLVKRHQPFVTDEQLQAARKLALSFDTRFQQLRRQRAEILEHATDESDVAQQLLDIKMDIADLITDVRYAISQQILTPDQRRQALQSFADELGF